MKAQLARNDSGEIEMLVEPESSTEAVAMDGHAPVLGFVWDPMRCYWILKQRRNEPAP